MSNQAIVVRPDENIKIIQLELSKPIIAEQLTKALSNLTRYVTPEKLIRVAMTAIRADDKLAISTPVSIIGSVIQLGQVGLVPDGFLGQAYLVPYWNKHIGRYEASPLIGYRGYGELAVRSGKATSVDGHVVFAGDTFEFEQGSNPYIRHKPTLDPKKRGDMIGAFAIVYMKEGPHRFEVMAMDEIYKVRDASQGADSKFSPWQTWFSEMARKSPMRRLAKWVPLSPEFQMAAGIDEAAELGTQRPMIDAATGQVFFTATGAKQEPSIERPKTIASSTPAAVQGSVAEDGRSTAKHQPESAPSATQESAPVVEQTAGESGQPIQEEPRTGTAQDKPSPSFPAEGKCFCTCCKNLACDCLAKDEVDQCGCPNCQKYMSLMRSNPEVKSEDRPTSAASSTAAPSVAAPGKPEGPYVASDKRKRLFAVAASRGWTVGKDSHDDPLHALLKEKFGIESINEIPVRMFNEVLNAVNPDIRVK